MRRDRRVRPAAHCEDRTGGDHGAVERDDRRRQDALDDAAAAQDVVDDAGIAAGEPLREVVAVDACVRVHADSPFAPLYRRAPRHHRRHAEARHPRRPAPLRGRANPVQADDAGARDRQARLRPGRPDPRAGAGAGPDPAPPRRRLPRRRPRAPLCAAAGRGRRVRQLRFPAAPAPGADASARGRAGVDGGRARAQRCAADGARLHPRARGRPTSLRDGRGALRAHGKPPHQRAWGGTGLQRDDAPARRHALPRPAARAAARQRHAHLRAGGCRRTPRRPTSAPAARCERAVALLELVVRKYAPLPASSLVYLARLLRYGAPHLQAGDASRRRADSAAARAAAAERPRRHGAVWPGRPTRTRCLGAAMRQSTTACACSRRSIRSSGTGAASNCSGAGLIASRPTRRRRSESSATTRCRCSGAMP